MSMGLFFGVFAVVPDIPDVFRILDVALLVKGQSADHGVEAAAADRLGDLLRIEGLGLLRGLGPDLHGGIGIERVAFRLVVLFAEAPAQTLCVWLLAGVERRSGVQGQRVSERE